MTTDLNLAAPSSAAPSPVFTINHSINYSEKTPVTSEEISAHMEAKATNLGYGLGEALGKTYAGKFLQEASSAFSKLADVIANLIPSLPVASANSVPANSPQIKTANKLKSSSSKIIGRYNLQELQIKEDQIYFDCENGDWFFSPLKLEPLNNFSEVVKIPAAYLVKRSKLFDIVTRNSYDNFHDLVLKARSNIMLQIQEKQGFLQMLLGDVVHDAWAFKEYKNITPAINQIFNFEYCEEFDLKIREFFLEQRKKLENMEAMSRDDYRIYLNNFYNDEFRKIIIDHLIKVQTDDNIKSLWKKINEHDLSGDENSKQLLTKYRSREQSNLENEKYFDRVEKVRKINNDANFRCIISSGKGSPLRDLPPPMGLVFSTSGISNRFYPNIVWNFVNAENSVARTTTHEALHMFDYQQCQADKFGFTVNEIDSKGEIITTPCSNEVIRDKQIIDKLLKAFNLDAARFIKFVNSVVQNKKFNTISLFADAGYRTNSANFDRDIKSLDNAFKVMSVLNPDTEYMEIIPYITDTLSPVQLISFCPNVAVIRSKTIYNDDRPGTAFYIAIMQCDITSVKNIIEKYPAVLNKEYDGIKLYELPKILVEAGYDKFVDKSFKKYIKNNYFDMNSLIQKEYEAYKKSKLKTLEDGKKQFSQAIEL